ncbi:MAG: biotin synthase BioB [Clostridia bacterium]|nr:biotin synthase BioB [Clostridia bacterium]
MDIINTLKEKIIGGGLIDKSEAMSLLDVDIEQLCAAADEIRSKLNGSKIDTCTILNGKSGLCTENCKYCAQSAHNHTGVKEYPMLTVSEIVERGLENAKLGVDRFDVVTAGLRLNDAEVDTLCKAYSQIKDQTDLELCSSNGLLSYEQFVRLHDAGVTRIHNNIETSRRFFPSVCTTHTYDEKIETIRAAKKAGMEICSGGIIGMGETMEDRIDMALELQSLGVRSIPINVLMPIKGTALENQPPLSDEEILRTVALFRFINPKADIRLAGGRKLLEDHGRQAFKSGANASIIGNMLTSIGNNVDEDFAMFEELGFTR